VVAKEIEEEMRRNLFDIVVVLFYEIDGRT
jgi:hypothetical protein